MKKTITISRNALLGITAIILAISTLLFMLFSGLFNSPSINSIRPKKFNNDEQKIVNMINMLGFEINSFEFKTDKTFTKYEVWGELYKKGELIETIKGPSAFSDEKDFKGFDYEITVCRQMKDALISYDFIQNTDDSIFSFSSDKFKLENIELLTYGTSIIKGSVFIEDEKEIVLSLSCFETNGMTTVFFDLQSFIDNPEQINDYDYIFILKCKFSK